MKPLKPSHVKTFIIDAIRCREIPYVAGSPAIGKSDIFSEVAEEYDLKMLDIRLSQKLPEDLSGLPSLDEVTNKATYIPFDTFPMQGDALPLDANGDEMNGWMIFLDELSSASEEVMAAIYSLLLGRMVGGRKIHDKAIIVAAGNRASDSAIARELPDTLITRMLPCEMKVNAKDWCTWAKGPKCKNTNQTVVEFITKYTDMLLETVESSAREELQAYANPRSWGKVMGIINLHEKDAKKNKITARDKAGIPTGEMDQPGVAITPNILNLMNAAIGNMASQAFREHYDEAMQLPYPWDVAQSPSSTRIPSTTIGKAKLTASLADHFIGTQEQSRDSILQFMNRMDPEQSALFAQTISEKVGSTPSDLKLVADVKKRLNVPDIAMPEADTKDGDGKIPF